MHSLLEPEQETEEEKEPEKEQDPTKPPIESKERGTVEEITKFCVENGLPASDGTSCFHKWEGNGWKNGQARILCWRSTIRSWKASGYMPSQKNGSKSTAIKENIIPNIITP